MRSAAEPGQGGARPVLVACGVRREAQIAEAVGGVVAVAGGGDGAWLEARLDALARTGAAGVMSFGLCGALVPELGVGDTVIGNEGDADWIEAVRATLSSECGRRKCEPQASKGEGGDVSFELRPLPHPGAARLSLSRSRGRGLVGAVHSHGTLALSFEDKAALHAATGAITVDMESHIAARVAARHGLPFGCLRVVSDTAADTLPPAFAVAMRRGGGTDVGAMLRSLATHPGQIPAFAHASANAVRALRRLELLGRLLGPRLGLPDLR